MKLPRLGPFSLVLLSHCAGPSFATRLDEGQSNVPSGTEDVSPLGEEQSLSGGSGGEGGAADFGGASSVDAGGAGAGASDGDAGAGGATPSPTEECPTVDIGLIEARFFSELQAASTDQIHPFFELRAVREPLALARVSVRYYYTREPDDQEVARCYWVTGDACPKLRMSFGDVPKPTVDADRYLEVRFAGGLPALTRVEPFQVRMGFSAAHRTLLQTNDYSYPGVGPVPTPGEPIPYRTWQKITVHVDDALVWGREPCP